MSSIIDGNARRFGWALLAMVLAGCARAPLAKDPPQHQKEAEPASPSCKRAAEARARVPELLSAGWLDRSRRLLDWADRSCPKEAATSRALRERVTSELTDARSTSELIKAARAAEAAHNPAEMRRLYDRAMTRAEADAGERIALDLRSGGETAEPRWSPDSRFFAIAEGEVVSLLERDTEFGAGFVETRRIGRWGVDVAALAFSPDSKTLAVATNDETIRWIDTTTFQEIKKLVHPPGPIAAAQFSEGRLDVFDRMAFSPDGRWFASRRTTGGYEASIIIWDAKTGALVRRIDWDFGGGAGTLEFSSDGRFVVSEGAIFFTFLYEWEVPSGRFVDMIPNVEYPPALRRREVIEEWMEKHGGASKYKNASFAFSPNGEWLTLSYTSAERKDGKEFVEASTGNLVSVAYDSNLGGGAKRASLSPTGTHLLSASNESVSLWDFGTPAKIQPYWGGFHEDGILAWTHDGSRFALGLQGRTEVRDTEGRKLASANGTAKHLSFSPDGMFLRITGDNGAVTFLPLEGDDHAARKEGPTAQARVQEQRFPRPVPEVLVSWRDLGIGFRGTRVFLRGGPARIATTLDLGAVELFGPDGDRVQHGLRCTLGTRAFPFEFCRGRFERPGLVLDALSSEGEVSP